MLDLEEEVRRAEEAKRILSHPLYIEAYEKLEAELRDAWINSPSKDVDGRESLWLSLRLLTKTRAHMQSLIESGRLAEVQLERRGISVRR